MLTSAQHGLTTPLHDVDHDHFPRQVTLLESPQGLLDTGPHRAFFIQAGNDYAEFHDDSGRQPPGEGLERADFKKSTRVSATTWCPSGDQWVSSG